MINFKKENIMEKVRFGIIGTGVIAHAFAKDAITLENVELVAVTSRTPKNTVDYAKEYNIPKSYPSVEQLLADESITAVYIATLHPTHTSYAVQALNAGKHVLCEKPAALNEQQMQKIIHAATCNKKLFMEAMTVGFNPIYQQMKLMLKQGVIGELLAVHAFDGKISSKIHKHRPDQAGGALMDMGIYNAFLITDLCGKPDSVWAKKRMSKWQVDGAITFGTQHGDIQTVSYCTMDTQSLNQAILMGSEGSLILQTPWTSTSGFTHINQSGKYVYHTIEHNLWLGHELRSFAQTIIEGKGENEIMPYEKSLNMIQLLDQVRACVGITLTEVD